MCYKKPAMVECHCTPEHIAAQTRCKKYNQMPHTIIIPGVELTALLSASNAQQASLAKVEQLYVRCELCVSRSQQLPGW
jgi:hypothetical protein